MSCGVGRRCGSDATLLWLWGRPADVALILPQAWKLPYAAPVALKRKKQNEKHDLKISKRSSCHGAAEMNLTSILGMQV